MSHIHDFRDQMDTARAVAAERRGRGLSTGKPAAGWIKAKPMVQAEPADEIDAMSVEISELRARLREAENDAAAARLSHGESGCVAVDFGAEFDALVGAGRQARPLSSRSHKRLRGRAGGHTMTNEEYREALRKLRFKPNSKETAQYLGLSVRQAQRIAAGEFPVPETLAKLIAMYLKHGVPVD